MRVSVEGGEVLDGFISMGGLVLWVGKVKLTRGRVANASIGIHH